MVESFQFSVPAFMCTPCLRISQWKTKTNGKTGDGMPTSREDPGWVEFQITSETVWMPEHNSLQLVRWVGEVAPNTDLLSLRTLSYSTENTLSKMFPRPLCHWPVPFWSAEPLDRWSWSFFSSYCFGLWRLIKLKTFSQLQNINPQRSEECILWSSALTRQHEKLWDQEVEADRRQHEVDWMFVGRRWAPGHHQGDGHVDVGSYLKQPQICDVWRQRPLTFRLNWRTNRVVRKASVWTHCKRSLMLVPFISFNLKPILNRHHVPVWTGDIRRY